MKEKITVNKRTYCYGNVNLPHDVVMYLRIFSAVGGRHRVACHEVHCWQLLALACKWPATVKQMPSQWVTRIALRGQGESGQADSHLTCVREQASVLLTLSPSLAARRGLVSDPLHAAPLWTEFCHAMQAYHPHHYAPTEITRWKRVLYNEN